MQPRVEVNERSGSVWVRESPMYDGRYPVRSVVMTDMLDEGITLNVRPGLGSGVLQGLPDRGLAEGSVRFGVGADGRTARDQLIVKGYTAQEVAEALQRPAPSAHHKDCVDILCSPGMAQAVGQGYHALVEQSRGAVKGG